MADLRWFSSTLKNWVQGGDANPLPVTVANVISGAALPNGQNTKASSVPVTIASDQALPFAVPFSYAAAQSHTALEAAPGAGKTLYITKLFVQNDTTADATAVLESDAAGTPAAVTCVFACAKASAGKAAYAFDFGPYGIPCAANKNLGITTTGTTNLTGLVCGYIA